jgi:multimeric flavodoxin WrbA
MDFMTLLTLKKHSLLDYDYAYQNQEDDFQKVIAKVLVHNHIIFATLIYWYGPSTVMKRFIDRISDLLDLHKDQGRRLRGKTMHFLATYLEPRRGKEGFEEFFKRIAEYLGIQFGQCLIYLMQAPAEQQKNLNEKIEKFRSFFIN